MPYKSRAQQNYFHYLESKGKMPKKTVHEFDESTDYSDLPKRKMAKGGMVDHLEYGDEEAPHDEEMMPHFADGGMISDNYDYQMGHASEFDSSGEPHTEDEMEDEHPMEYMSRGGRAGRKMAMGGRARFVKALRMGR